MSGKRFPAMLLAGKVALPARSRVGATDESAAAAHGISRPPLTSITWPVTKLEKASEAK